MITQLGMLKDSATYILIINYNDFSRWSMQIPLSGSCAIFETLGAKTCYMISTKMHSTAMLDVTY